MKAFRFVVALIFTVIALGVAPTVFAAGHGQDVAPAFDATVILGLVLLIPQLGGIGFLWTTLTNVLKYYGVVKDGDAGAVVAVLNLVTIIILIAAHYLWPTVTPSYIDSQASVIAQILTLVFSYASMLGSSFVFHKLLSTMQLPVIGASHEHPESLRVQ